MASARGEEGGRGRGGRYRWTEGGESADVTREAREDSLGHPKRDRSISPTPVRHHRGGLRACAGSRGC